MKTAIYSPKACWPSLPYGTCNSWELVGSKGDAAVYFQEEEKKERDWGNQNWYMEKMEIFPEANQK